MILVPMKKDAAVDESADEYLLNSDEEVMLQDLLARELRGEHPDLSELSDRQLDKFIAYVLLMKNLLHTQPEYGRVHQLERNQQMCVCSDQTRY